MILTGIADEAGAHIETQIKATKELGWKYIEARNVQVDGYEKGNTHDIPEDAFKQLADRLEESGIGIYAFGSTIANWGKKIDQPFDLSDVERAIPRMHRLGAKYVRIMSYAVREDEDQLEEERFRRVREITHRFLEAGITPVHENCMNYGGMSPTHALKLLENVPGLRWVFDTGNPVFNADYSKPIPYPRQDAWEFWDTVREHVAHIHIKDGRWNEEKQEAEYTWPGEGDGQVWKILADALMHGYEGGISIEPHLAVVFHDSSVTSSAEHQYKTYVEYGRRLEKLIADVKARIPAPSSATGATA